MLGICRYYGTTGHPKFRPKCYHPKYPGVKRPSLKCHEERKDCRGYVPSREKKERKVNGKKL